MLGVVSLALAQAMTVATFPTIPSYPLCHKGNDSRHVARMCPVQQTPTLHEVHDDILPWSPTNPICWQSCLVWCWQERFRRTTLTFRNHSCHLLLFLWRPSCGHSTNRVAFPWDWNARLTISPLHFWVTTFLHESSLPLWKGFRIGLSELHPGVLVCFHLHPGWFVQRDLDCRYLNAASQESSAHIPPRWHLLTGLSVLAFILMFCSEWFSGWGLKWSSTSTQMSKPKK